MSKRPLYVQIVNYIENKIRSEEWAKGDKIPSEKELAELFGVSLITSKRALRELQMAGKIISKKGSGSFVASSLKIEESGRQQIGEGASKTISLVLPLNAQAHEMKDFISGASSFLRTKDYFLTVHVTSGNVEQEKIMLMELAEKKMGGIIFYPCYSSKNAGIVATLRMNGVPMVTIDKSYDGLPVSSVISDNYRGGFLSAEYLIQLGHKKIAYLSNTPIGCSSSIRDRYLGFSNALAQYGAENEIENHLLDFTFKEGDEIEAFQNYVDYYMEFLKKLKQRGVTALVCSCDVLAYWIMDICKKLGYSVPEDFSVIGFDKIDLPFQDRKELTTVRQDFYCIGYKAAEVMWDIINGKTNDQTITLPVEFIKGKTVKALIDKQENSAENLIS